MEAVGVQGFTYEERQGVLPDLTAAFAECGGWVVNRRTLSPTQVEFRVEIQLRSVVELYGAMIASGLELTRNGHKALTELCNRRKHLRAPAGLGQIVAIRLEVSFLEDVTVHALLTRGAGLA